MSGATKCVLRLRAVREDSAARLYLRLTGARWRWTRSKPNLQLGGAYLLVIVQRSNNQIWAERRIRQRNGNGSEKAKIWERCNYSFNALRVGCRAGKIQALEGRCKMGKPVKKLAKDHCRLLLCRPTTSKAGGKDRLATGGFRELAG